jgi:hypothetical protein
MRMPGPAVLAVLTVVLLAGCGVQEVLPGQDAGPGEASAQPGPVPVINGLAEVSAQEAVSRAKQAFLGAPGVHVVLTAPAENLTADIQIQGNDHARVTMTKDSDTVKVIVVGSVVYLHAKNLGDGWTKSSTSDKQFAKFAPLIKRDQLFTTFVTAAAKPAMKSSQGGKVNGHDSVKLAGGTVAIYLATDGAPYPLRVVDTAGSGGGAVDFTDYGARVTITAPPASKVIAASRPGGAGADAEELA